MTSWRKSIDPDPDDAELRAILQLRFLPALLDQRLNSLLARYDPKSLIENASPDLLGGRAWQQLSSRVLSDRVERALRMIDRDRVMVVTVRDAAYPACLRPLGELAPPILFCRGRIELLNGRIVAIIGARDSTEYGDSVAELLASELARRGITVVSGLARGIDGIAHASALAAGGGTIGVLGCGIDVFYPPSNARLQEKIAEAGLLISEFAPGAPALRKNFPQRNRLIAMLGSGVLVVEAGVKSGTRNTVEWALTYNKEVFAVPGPIGRRESQGTNEIIQDGGHLVISVRDVLEVLHWHDDVQDLAPSDDDAVPTNADATTRAVYRAIQTTSTHVDEIARRCGLSVPAALTQLMQLELDGLIVQHPGKRFARVLVPAKRAAETPR